VATLTQTAKQVKIMINVVLACTIIFIGYRIVVKIFQGLQTFTPTPIVPDNLLGKISFPTFSTVDIDSKVTYTLDLIDSDLPTSPKIMPVYTKIPYTVGLLSPERAKEIAKNYNYDPEQYNEITSTKYQWTDLNLPRNITIDLTTRNFEINYDYKKDPSVFTQTTFRSQQNASTKAIQILNRGKSLPDDINSGKQITTLMTWKNEQFTEATDYDTKNSAKIYFQRQDITIIDENEKENVYPAVGDTPDKGPIYMEISSSPEQNKDILKLTFNYYSVDTTKSGTYYIKSASEAWQEIQLGKGNVVFFDAPTGKTYSEIAIKRVYLAYFDQTVKQDYLQPIWVFVGEAKLNDKSRAIYISYLTAVTDDWIEKNEAVDEVSN